MLIGARTAAWGGKALPYEREVSFIRNNGTDILDTGVIINSDDVIVLKMKTIARNQMNGTGIWDNMAGGNVVRVYVPQDYYGRYYWYFGRSLNPSYAIPNIESIEEVLIDGKNKVGSYNGTQFSMSYIDTFTTTISLTFFGQHANDNGIVSYIPFDSIRDINSIKIMNGNVVKCDIIPVAIGNDGYAFDKAHPDRGLIGDAITGSPFLAID